MVSPHSRTRRKNARTSRFGSRRRRPHHPPPYSLARGRKLQQAGSSPRKPAGPGLEAVVGRGLSRAQVRGGTSFGPASVRSLSEDTPRLAPLLGMVARALHSHMQKSSALEVVVLRRFRWLSLWLVLVPGAVFAWGTLTGGLNLDERHQEPEVAHREIRARPQGTRRPIRGPHRRPSGPPVHRRPGFEGAGQGPGAGHRDRARTPVATRHRGHQRVGRHRALRARACASAAASR